MIQSKEDDIRRHLYVKTIYKDEIERNHDKKKRVKCVCTPLSFLGLDFCGLGNCFFFSKNENKKITNPKDHIYGKNHNLKFDLRSIKTDRPAEQLYRRNVQGLLDF